MLPAYYQDFKLVILKFLFLSRDAVHIHVGFFALIATVLLTKKKMNQWSILLPGFILSLGMEALDIWGDLLQRGKVDPMASLHDLWNTNLIPLVLVLLVKKGKFLQNQKLD